MHEVFKELGAGGGTFRFRLSIIPSQQNVYDSDRS